MAYSKNTWIDGTTSVDASRMNNIENALGDQDSRISDNLNAISSACMVDKGPSLSNIDLFEFAEEYCDSKTKSSAINICMFHLNSSNVTSIPSSSYQYCTGFLFVGSDVYHIVLFPYGRNVNKIAIASKTASASNWSGWYQFSGTEL